MTRIINSLRINLKIGGVSGFLPAVFTRRTVESNDWTLYRAFSLGNNNSVPNDWNNDVNTPPEEVKAKLVKDNRRWMFAMRYGERVDDIFGRYLPLFSKHSWVNKCFDKNGEYRRIEAKLPLKLAERAGGKESWIVDTPLTKTGQYQAHLTGESFRLAGVNVTHVYASAALRCVETAHSFLEGLQADPSVKIRVDPGLFECKLWYFPWRVPLFMTPIELHEAGLNVDLKYKPYVDLAMNTPETLEDYYKRAELVMQSAVKDTEKEGGNILFVGHAETLDTMVIALKRLDMNKAEYPPYKLHNDLLKVPYCAFGAVRDNPWQLVCPPCLPAIFSRGGLYNWRSLEGADA